jgi:hypothetical protein
MEYDSETVAFCDRCEKQTTRVFPGMSETQIDNGLHVYASGYYGGFWDTMSFAGKEGIHIHLCHDCSEWLCKEIPAFGKEAKGGHGFGSSTRERCCEFAGDWDDEDCPNRQREESSTAIPEGWQGYEIKEKV